MAHFLPPDLVRQVNKLEWPKPRMTEKMMINMYIPFYSIFVLYPLDLQTEDRQQMVTFLRIFSR